MTYSLYFHIPFCIHRCAYCDFNTYAGLESLIPVYVQALCNEIEIVASSAGKRMSASTIFFGGGTPSLLSANQFELILTTVQDFFDLDPTAEISLEANPGTVLPDYFHDLRNLGFNRLSLGVQSTHPAELHQLERIHDYYDVIEAVTKARQAGFDNLNLDLIYGLPEQRLERWQASVKLILGLNPEHLSLYALTVEHGTPFGRWMKKGTLPVPDPDLAADMYELADEILENQGYENYEISNWAKPGRQCLHNLTYWRGRPYLGFGAGAHGFAGGFRISNVLRIKTYIERLLSDPSIPDSKISNKPFPISPVTVNQTQISRIVEMQETMMTGLRLTQEGISNEEFQNRFGIEMAGVFGKEIEELTVLGLLEQSGGSIRLTKHGRLMGNQVFMRFVD